VINAKLLWIEIFKHQPTYKSKILQNTLTLYFIPSPFGIDWRSPSTLARTIVKNKLAIHSRFMGHVNIELKGITETHGEIDYLTGMTARNMKAVPLLLKEKMGLGILFHSFEGMLEKKELLIPELMTYLKQGNEKINFVQFVLNEQTTDKLVQYLKQYKENGLDKYYGLYNDPLKCEGAGCSAFGASFMRVSGLLDSDMLENWRCKVKVPLQLSGKPLTDKGPSFFKLLFKEFTWAQDHEPHKEITFWDPDLMHRWVENKRLSNGPYEMLKMKNTFGLKIDQTKHEIQDQKIWSISSDNDLKPILPNLL